MNARSNTQSAAAWLFLVDQREGRLLRCLPQADGRTHIEEVETLVNTWEGREKGRPSPLAAKDGHSYASATREEDETAHRFAKEIVAWLENQFKTYAVDHLHLFAPPHFLGVLRQSWNDALAERITTHSNDLLPLRTAELLEEPSVQAVLARSNSKR